jgi:hypothetical protein
MDIGIDLAATRGTTGFTATIDITPSKDKGVSFTKAVIPAATPEPATAPPVVQAPEPVVATPAPAAPVAEPEAPSSVSPFQPRAVTTMVDLKRMRAEEEAKVATPAPAAPTPEVAAEAPAAEATPPAAAEAAGSETPAADATPAEAPKSEARSLFKNLRSNKPN